MVEGSGRGQSQYALHSGIILGRGGGNAIGSESDSETAKLGSMQMEVASVYIVLARGRGRRKIRLRGTREKGAE